MKTKIFKESMKKLIIPVVILMIVLGMIFGYLLNDSKSNDIVILYTNDIHCEIEDNVSYAGLSAYKKGLEENYRYVSLVDCGDAIQGEFIGTVSKGKYIVDIMNRLGYDFAIPGNHEFDYGMPQLSALIDSAEAQYLGCNITYSGNGENLLKGIKPYEIVEYGRTKVAFIGVATPESYTKSTPIFFMENDEYVYNFSQGEDGKELYDCVQGYVDECEEKGADYIVALSHLGNVEESSPYTSTELIQSTSGIDAVLDGHAHSVIPGEMIENKSGEKTLLTSTGTKLQNIGKLVIDEDGNITSELISGYSAKDTECTAFIDNIKSQYENEMNKVVASSDIELSCYDSSGIRLVRNRETAIGNLCADAFRITGNADIGVINGGGIRDNIAKGDITYADMLAVQPFGNTLCVAEASGQEIVDLLESACMNTEKFTEANGVVAGENGGFLQVSGIKFTIDTSIKSSVELDEKGNFVSVTGQRRVQDVMVLKDGVYVPINLKDTYTIASYNYILKEGGNGYTAFIDNTYLTSEGISDYQVLTQYISEMLDGKLGKRYAAPEGRITVK